MDIEKANGLLGKIESDVSAQNFIAQADSRFILFNVEEPIENFPKFTKRLDERLTSIALSYLSIGCSFAENGISEKAVYPLEKGATILELVHGPEQNRGEDSIYYLIASSLAYYAGFQYSRSFILLSKVEVKTDVAQLIKYFLGKNYQGLIGILNKILISGEYSNASIVKNTSESDAKIYTVLLARSLSSLLEYIYSGKKEWLYLTKDILYDLLLLLEIDEEPSMWWVTRLFKIIVNKFFEASLWGTIAENVGGVENQLVRKFILGLTFRKLPAVELFLSQRYSLPRILGKSGAVVCLPTSSGKTRIAEIAILETLLACPEGIVLYLAPFRSLAYEIEETLEPLFLPLGIEVSHLYGTNQFSKIDRTLIEESNIIIATPEKAKAIFRADPGIVSRVKLAIIDEGHLLGANDRYIAIEIFLEELKVFIEKNEGKVILLSAVLPNTDDISRWITGDEGQSVDTKWRLSLQRFGLLVWTGTNVNIEWQGDIQSFNRSFVEKFKVKRPRSEYVFPSNKKQAIAATAVKLSSLGSVLIFVGRKKMVESQAREVLQAMGKDPEPQNWINKDDWSIFELACNEAYGAQSDILDYARYGIICHSAELPTDVRSSVEKLMRNGNPRIIISTSTLAQGVNIGVSSVIVANVWIGPKVIDNRDFWNIAGRAGRAFIDGEGRILFAIDRTKEQWQIDRDRELAAKYFDIINLEPASSGILKLIEVIVSIAKRCNISFELLLQLISENDFGKFIESEGKDYGQNIAEFFDYIDDTLLALNLELESFNLDDSSEWVDDVFRKSLAYIQAEKSFILDGEQVISFLKARNKGVLNLAGESSKWKPFVSCGIPLRSGIAIRERIEEILEMLSSFQESSQALEDLTCFLKGIEKLIWDLPSSHFRLDYAENELDAVRKLWIAGKPLREITERFSDGQDICNQYFGFTLPWALNSIARIFANMKLDDESQHFEELAVFSELGLPSLFAVKIYLAGIRSRAAATELSGLLNSELKEKSIKKVGNYITTKSDEIQKHCSKYASKWVKALAHYKSRDVKTTEKIRAFSFKKEIEIQERQLNARSLNSDIYLCSPTYKEKIKVAVTEDFPFDKVADNPGVYFVFDKQTKDWNMAVRDPSLRVID